MESEKLLHDSEVFELERSPSPSDSQSADRPLLSHDVENIGEKDNGDVRNLHRPRSPIFTRLLAWLQLVPVYFRAFLLVLVPSFIQPLLPGYKVEPKRKLHATAYLDGMRGIASAFVFIFHFSYMIHDTSHGWGYKGTKHDVLRLPFIRVFYGSGNTMVEIFFIVSGFALSLKPLEAARRHDWATFRRALSSSTFRRALRLYLPCLAVSLFTFILIRLRVYEYTAKIAFDRTYITHGMEKHPQRLPTFGAQLHDLWVHWIFWVNPWNDSPFQGREIPPYDGRLWSIAAEFKMSLLLFISLSALAGLRSRWRLMCLAIVVVFAYCFRMLSLLLFHYGMALAELHCIRAERQRRTRDPLDGDDGIQGELKHSTTATSTLLPLHLQKRLRTCIPHKRSTLPSDRLWTAWYIFIFVVAWYLISSPIKGIPDTPGYRFISTFTPARWVSQENRYIGSFGAVLMVWSVSACGPLQRLFDNAFSQYLGRISFMIYILHGLVLHTVGYACFMSFWAWTGIETDAARETGFLMAFGVIVLTLVWISDLFYRIVDQPSVTFAKWFEGILTAPEPAVAP